MKPATRRFRVTWLDRLLMSISPKWALRRVRARAAAYAYEATSGGRRTAGWHRTPTDANAANGAALASLRELSRDLRRNNAWARRGINVIAANTVGYGIVAKAVGVPAGIATKAGDLWRDWSNSVGCDYHGRLPFSGIQDLVMRTIAESGEALVVRQPGDIDLDGIPIPLRIQVLEPDYIDTTKDDSIATTRGSAQKAMTVQGIEFDAQGRRVAYWLHQQHPGNTRFGFPFESKRVEAKNVIHIYDVERAGQVRGVPWLACAIARLNDFDDFDDAQLMQQKVAACFGAFVTDPEGTGSSFLQNATNGDGTPVDPLIESLEPGMVTQLPPGKTVTFATPPAVTDASFSQRTLRRIAAGLGVTYEDLTGDYSQVNFSSARMARISHYQQVWRWQWHMIIPQLCDGVWRWAMELAAGVNDWPTVPSARWTPPPMPMLDPKVEGEAYSKLVRNGAMTLFEMIRERGNDPELHLAEIAEGNALLDKLEITLDSDPRKFSPSGSTPLEGEDGAVPAPEPSNGKPAAAGANGAHPNGRSIPS